MSNQFNNMQVKDIARILLNDKDYEHTERVVVCCQEIIDNLPVNVNVKDTLDAAWLHDTGKSVDDDNHRKKENILKALKPYKDNLSNMDTLVEIIHAHGGKKEKFNPPAACKLESAILRLADKVDRYNKGKSDAPEKCKESKEILKGILSKNEWKGFRMSYWNMMARTIDGALSNLKLDSETRKEYKEAFQKAQEKYEKARKKAEKNPS